MAATTTARRPIVIRSRTFLPDQDLDPAVLRSRWIVRKLRTSIRVTFDMLDPARIDAGTNQHVVRHLRARGRKPPVVIAFRPVRSIVGMAADNDHTRTLRQQWPDLVDDEDELGTRFG